MHSVNNTNNHVLPTVFFQNSDQDPESPRKETRRFFITRLICIHGRVPVYRTEPQPEMQRLVMDVAYPLVSRNPDILVCQFDVTSEDDNLEKRNRFLKNSLI